METLKERLKDHEGFSPTIYRCPAGYWTIGYGHRIGAHWRISPQVGELLLEEDIHKRTFEYLSLGWDLDLVRQDVIIEMIFWMGLCGTLNFKKMCAAIEQKDWNKAADEMLDSRAARNYPVRMNGLAKTMRNGG